MKHLIEALTSGKISFSEAVEQTEEKGLNKDLWRGKDVDPAARKNLLQIADDLIKTLEVHDPTVKDVVLTGSMANYNWTDSSDIDLHILLDFSKIDAEEDLLADYFYDTAALWNEHHDVKMHGHPVEVYIQSHTSKFPDGAGIYSLKRGTWVKMPPKTVTDPPEETVKLKADMLRRRINRAIAACKGDNAKQAYAQLESLRERIRAMRQTALQKGGERAAENLAFKALRRDGTIDKLINTSRTTYDKLMSLGESVDRSLLLDLLPA